MAIAPTGLHESEAVEQAPFEARVHGGLDVAELEALGLSPDSVLDFSSSTNPYGPHPIVRGALEGALLTRYPDSGALEARRALSTLSGHAAQQIVLGNGAAELLWTLARTLLAAGEGALIVEPTFAEFRAAARACRARISEWRAAVEASFAIDLEAVSAAARAAACRVVYLCNPNTPTGTALPASDVAAWAGRHRDLAVVLDESFASLSERFADRTVAMPGNVVRVRSLTKDHGIPGVRVGYLIAREELARAVENNRPQWSTSAYAQAAAIAAARCEGFVTESRARLLQDRDALSAALERAGLEPLPTTTTFLIARVPSASSLRQRLLAEHGILIRDCSSFGLPGFVRLAARPAPERARLAFALQEIGRCSPRP